MSHGVGDHLRLLPNVISGTFVPLSDKKGLMVFQKVLFLVNYLGQSFFLPCCTNYYNFFFFLHDSKFSDVLTYKT